MNNDFRNKDIKYSDNNDDIDNEKLPGNLTKLKIKVLRVSSFIIFLSICFFLSFYLSFKVMNKNEDEINKNVVNSKRETLDDDLILKMGDDVFTIAEFKESEDIDYEITQEDLETRLKQKGYEFNYPSQNTIEITNMYEPNKFYLGLSNGYMALFESDDNGLLKLVHEYKDKIKSRSLPEQVLNDLEKYMGPFDSREDVEIEMTGFLS